jgi:hypothetical protein
VSTSSASLALGRFRSVRVLSTPLRSPSRRRALHLLVFSTSSLSPPLHLLHFLVVFSIPSLFSPPRHCPPPLPRLLHSGVMFSMSLPCHLRWCSPRCRRFPLLVAALDAIVVFAPWVTTPALHFPCRRSLCGTLCRRHISSLFTVALPCWLSPTPGSCCSGCRGCRQVRHCGRG